MIFYLCNGNQLAGTQADARQLDRNFVQVDVPTDKAGLMAYINELMARAPVAPEPELVRPEPTNSPEVKASTVENEWTRCPKCNNTRRLASFYAGLEGAQAIREAIRTCDPDFINGHVDAVIDRLKELKIDG